MKSDFLIIDGKLIHNYSVIKPEIGNPEHIKAFKLHQIASDVCHKGFTLRVEKSGSLVATLVGRCMDCSKIIESDPFTYHGESDIPSDIQCNYCGNVYEIITQFKKLSMHGYQGLEILAVREEDYMNAKKKFNLE